MTGLRRRFDFRVKHKEFFIRLAEDGALELHLDNCLRKARPRSEKEPQYVWTNVELDWEEHRYIEARYWASEGRLRVTVNGEVLYDERTEGGATPAANPGNC